ncbi:OFA family MFS transporter [Thermodesulfobacteriota bacterium]
MLLHIKDRSWIVTFSGTGINLALGILYTWSIFKGSIKESIEAGGVGAFDWSLSSLNDPYAVCCIVFAFAMILAGKCQDRFGPRVTAFIGGLLVGTGFIWISSTTDYVVWILGFGLLAGTGIGFGYSAATPPALKWFSPAKTGMIAGIVVSGFGLASVYIAPVSKYFLGTWGLQKAMLFFGVAFLIVVCGLSMKLVNPPEGYRPKEEGNADAKKTDVSQKDARPSVMIKTRAFYTIWFIYFIGAGAGLMVIGSVAGMAKQSMGEMAFLVVAIMAIGNAAGRIIAGVLSDRIGRRATLTSMLLFQTVLMLSAIPIVGSEHSSAVALVILATLIGFNYGTNLSLFPSITKDNWGLKNFGTNYGIVFTAWGVGGLVMGRLSQMLQASTGNYTSSFLTAAILLIIGVLLTFTLKDRRDAEVAIQKEITLSFGESN